MKSFIVITITAGIFSILFSILFDALNESMVKLFAPMETLLYVLQRKKLYRSLTFILFITIGVVLREHYKLTDINYGLILGFFISLRDTIFVNNN